MRVNLHFQFPVLIPCSYFLFKKDPTRSRSRSRQPPETNGLPRKPRRESPLIGQGDDGDHGISTGRRVIGAEDDHGAIESDLDRAPDDRDRARSIRSGERKPHAGQASADPVGFVRDAELGLEQGRERFRIAEPVIRHRQRLPGQIGDGLLWLPLRKDWRQWYY